MAPSAGDAGNTKPTVMQCDGLGSYGLRAALDVTWDATAWSDVGRGTIELYGLVELDAVDPKTHVATGGFRACGLTLPRLNSSALCSSYQLQFPEGIWDDELSAQKFEGTYECDATSCTLKLSPASYALGIQLKDAHGPWPDVDKTMGSQFSDDDRDGLPGISIDVTSGASMPTGQSACSPTDPTGPSSGNPGPGNQWPITPTAPTPAVPTQIGQLLVGLRTQLTAAMTLSPECELLQASASKAAIDLRAAGCFVADGMDPASASLGCSEELRVGYDETLPQYDVLEKGKAPKSSGPGAGPSRKEPSAGTLLKVVRFAPGTDVGCEAARSITF